MGLGINKLIFPPGAGVASAFGMLTANPGFEFARSLPSPLSTTPWQEVRKAVASMIREGSRQLAGSGVPRGDVKVDLAADVRHRGQGEALTVELGSALRQSPARQIEEAFEQAYVRLYGRRPPGVESEVMTWRVRVMGPAPRLDVRRRARPIPTRSARKERRRAWFSQTGFVPVDVFDRYLLSRDAEVRGPAVVEEIESTVVVGPGARGRIDRYGSLVVEMS